MKVAIVGSRYLTSFDGVVRFVNALAQKYPDAVVVSGGARGVDSYAELAATNNGLAVRSFRPYKTRGGWYCVRRVIRTREDGVVADDPYPPPPDKPSQFRSFRDAAFERNGWIVGEADQVVAFWDGQSRGTADSIRKAEALGKPVHVYRV